MKKKLMEKLKASRPEWQSTEFNEFMDTLDIRASASINNSIHPRRDRFLGSPSKGDASVGAPEWMITNRVILPPPPPPPPKSPEMSF